MHTLYGTLNWVGKSQRNLYSMMLVIWKRQWHGMNVVYSVNPNGLA